MSEVRDSLSNEKSQTPEARLSVAVLAVGTEVTDGQIVDRNSAWIAQRAVLAGLRVVEHRAVADDAQSIARSLSELASRVDLLFVTGGLGPTSDDFTRNIISEVFSRPLEFDAGSWRGIVELLNARGIEARDIQKQQCFFPKGATILKNTAGTANAFYLVENKGAKIFALPGPPNEIAVIWDAHIADLIASLTPISMREQLKVIRCLGLGESGVAEIVEEILQSSHLRVGYRAHSPYVEVKLWFIEEDRASAQPFILQVEQALSNWVVNRDNEDVVDALIELSKSQEVRIIDAASDGMLAKRLFGRIEELGAAGEIVKLSVETLLVGETSQLLKPRISNDSVTLAHSMDSVEVGLRANIESNRWEISLKIAGFSESVLEVSPPFNYKVLSERGRRFITEKLFISIGQLTGKLEE